MTIYIIPAAAAVGYFQDMDNMMKGNIMEKKLMDDYIDEFVLSNNNEYYSDADTMKKLFDPKMKFAFNYQRAYEDPDCLQENFQYSVLHYTGNKDAAIRVYKDFFDFLKEKGISAEVKFPPVPVTSLFERLMFIAKFLHEPDAPNHEIKDLPDLLWVSARTIESDIQKLTDLDYDPIQICGRVFKIPETKRRKNRIHSASTTHPLFLTLNLAQVIVMLKGLKEMSEQPQFTNYAETAAADIWDQLSDYAKKRISYVMSDLMHEDPGWYESLKKRDNHLFNTERAYSNGTNIIFYSLKNEEKFCVEVKDGDKTLIYTNCTVISWNNNSVTVMSDEGEKTFLMKNVLRGAYTKEELY